MIVIATGPSCQSDSDDEAARLQALLHDDPLQQVPPGAAARTETSSLDPSGPPVGAWNFDDCNPDFTQLEDSTFTNNTAFRAVTTACTDGVQGQGVAIANREDIIYVPDQPTFTFEGGVTVGGWFKPTSISGTRTLIRKRDRDTSSFALVLTGGKFQFVASFGPGRAASVTALTKAQVGVFQHVAASYDGAVLRLYVNGLEVNHIDVTGTIPIGAGPLLMGNDGSERRFAGTIDGVAFATHALNPEEVLQLTCLSERPSVVFPTELPPAQIGQSVPIDIALTNHNPPGACAPLRFDVAAFAAAGVIIDVPPGTPNSPPVPSGETVHMTVTATPAGSAEPGTVPLAFIVIEETTNFFQFAQLQLTIAPSTGCQVRARRELMITNTQVVDDARRTAFDPTSTDPRNGAWTFKRLIENIAPSAAAAPAMVEAMFTTFTTPQTINGFTVPARPGMQQLILASWPRLPGGELDLAQAPLRLQAVVNRLDLRNLANGDAGEGRFVFAFQRSTGQPLQATIILEYKLPAATEQDVRDWAQSFHALGALPFGEGYNAALQAITDRFTARGARPGHPNGSAINSVRTNEIDLGGGALWELREFRLSPVTGLLEAQPVELTPDLGFNNSATLASYIEANKEAIIAEKHVVPLVFEGQPFQGGTILNDLTTWFAPGADPLARHKFALNTCNGCHSAQETRTTFLHIQPRFPGTEAGLSSFLAGGTVPDPVTGEIRVFDELGRRKQDMEGIVCPGAPALPGTSLRKGISRVH